MVINRVILIVLNPLFLSNGKTKLMVTVRRKPDFKKNFYEDTAWKARECVCGVDEVGRGSLAGPLVTAAVILNSTVKSRLIKDSKELTCPERLRAYTWILNNGVAAVGVIHHRAIDTVNIYRATLMAMKRAVIQVLPRSSSVPSYILVDALPLTIEGQSKVIAFPKGESKSISIAAASIIAKVTRDRIMESMGNAFPSYGIGQHKGYATALHRKNIELLGRSIIHRTSFVDHFDLDEEQLTLSDGGYS